MPARNAVGSTAPVQSGLSGGKPIQVGKLDSTAAVSFHDTA